MDFSCWFSARCLQCFMSRSFCDCFDNASVCINLFTFLQTMRPKEILKKTESLWLPPEEVRNILDVFYERIDQQEGITAGGMFNINSTSGASVFSFIVTYLTILSRP